MYGSKNKYNPLNINKHCRLVYHGLYETLDIVLFSISVIYTYFAVLSHTCKMFHIANSLAQVTEKNKNDYSDQAWQSVEHCEGSNVCVN